MSRSDEQNQVLRQTLPVLGRALAIIPMCILALPLCVMPAARSHLVRTCVGLTEDIRQHRKRLREVGLINDGLKL